MPSGNVSITPFDNDQTVNGVTYDTDYVLFEKKQTRSGDETLDSLYVVEQHVFVKRVTIVSVDSDKQFPYSGYNVSGDPYGGLISKETLYYRDEVVYATVDFSDSEEDTAGIQTGGYRIFSVHNSDDAKRRLSMYLPIRMRFTSIIQEVPPPPHIIFGVLIQMVLCARASSCPITGMHYPKDK